MSPYTPSPRAIEERKNLLREYSDRDLRNAYLRGWIEASMAGLDEVWTPDAVSRAVTDVRAMLAAANQLDDEECAQIEKVKRSVIGPKTDPWLHVPDE